MPIIGDGSEDNHFKLHITSRQLMENLSKDGIHHIDGTYKITTYGYPLVVYGVIQLASFTQ